MSDIPCGHSIWISFSRSPYKKAISTSTILVKNPKWMTIKSRMQSFTSSEYFLEKLTPSTWWCPHATKHYHYTPMSLILNIFFFAPTIFRQQTFMYLSSYMLLIHIINLLLNGLLPFSSWLLVCMILGFIKCLGHILVNLAYLGTMAIVGKQIKKGYIFNCIIFLSYLLDNFANVFVVWI